MALHMECRCYARACLSFTFRHLDNHAIVGVPTLVSSGPLTLGNGFRVLKFALNPLVTPKTVLKNEEPADRRLYVLPIRQAELGDTRQENVVVRDRRAGAPVIGNEQQIRAMLNGC